MGVLCRKVCSAFCLLSAVLLLFFGQLMAAKEMVSFTMPALENKYDLAQKASACRWAAVYYLVAAVLLVVGPALWAAFFATPCGHMVQGAVHRCCFTLQQRVNLTKQVGMMRYRKGSDLTDDGNDDEQRWRQDPVVLPQVSVL
jgi:hypothetical protein